MWRTIQGKRLLLKINFEELQTISIKNLEELQKEKKDYQERLKELEKNLEELQKDL